jgi:hypothetical protein
MRSRSLTTAIALAATGAAAAMAAAGSSAAPVAHVARNCPIGTGEEFHGYTYVTAIAESGTTCSVADSLIKAHGHQSGWRCTTKRGQSSQFQYQASTTCTNGVRKVIWNFSENIG